MSTDAIPRVLGCEVRTWVHTNLLASKVAPSLLRQDIYYRPDICLKFFQPRAWRLTFPKLVLPPGQPSNFSRAQWQLWVQNLRNCWPNCNLQFLFNYTKYYTSAIFACKSLIYNVLWRAWISVNQGFAGQNFGQSSHLFLSVMPGFIALSIDHNQSTKKQLAPRSQPPDFSTSLPIWGNAAYTKIGTRFA